MTLLNRMHPLTPTMLLPPAWVGEQVAEGTSSVVVDEAIVISRGANSSIVSCRLAGASELADEAFEAAVASAYRRIFSALEDDRHSHPVRFWNFVPDIGRIDAGGGERYHIFNAGRFIAFEKQYGGRAMMPASIATASAVGHHGEDLFIHCLARSTPGTPVDNPSQIRPYRYSEKYGPLPPCFSRGTLIDGRTLLVGGTASILGETTVHQNDLAEQTQQTLVNLGTLVQAAGLATTSPLESFTSLRVYHPRLNDRERLMELLDDQFSNVDAIEYLQADLCRGDLLVEIEGVCGAVRA